MGKRKCLNCNDSFYENGIMKCKETGLKVFADYKCNLGKENIRSRIACEGNPYYKGK